MKAELCDIANIMPDPANVRKHDDRNIATIKASLLTFGQQKPIVVNTENVVVAGNGTLAAAQALGWSKIAVVRTKLKGAQATAYAIADNRTAELAEWDDDALAETLAALQNDETIDELAAGFTGKEIEDLINQATGLDVTEDDVPDVPVEAITKPGDLWLLGDHRVLCGDSTKAEDVGRLMGGEKAQIVFTDPPYGVNYKSSAKAAISGDLTQAAIPLSYKAAIELATDGDARLYWCGGSGNFGMYLSLFDAYLHRQPALIIWVKPSFVMRPNNYHSQFEVIYFGWRGTGGSIKCWYGDRKASDVWQLDREPGEYSHPTQKPVELVAKALTYSCPKSGLVYDPFLGSGTTLIAAEQLGRKCYGLEISPQYCDVIVKRWSNLTGGKAELER